VLSNLKQVSSSTKMRVFRSVAHCHNAALQYALKQFARDVHFADEPLMHKGLIADMHIAVQHLLPLQLSDLEKIASTLTVRDPELFAACRGDLELTRKIKTQSDAYLNEWEPRTSSKDVNK